jgi:hypothetical protein
MCEIQVGDTVRWGGQWRGKHYTLRGEVTRIYPDTQTYIVRPTSRMSWDDGRTELEMSPWSLKAGRMTLVEKGVLS